MNEPTMQGCGYCTHCGYGGEGVDTCLHKRPVPMPKQQQLYYSDWIATAIVLYFLLRLSDVF